MVEHIQPLIPWPDTLYGSVAEHRLVDFLIAKLFHFKEESILGR